MSDVNGVGSWTSLPVNTSTVIGTTNDLNTVFSPAADGSVVDIKRSINLKSGKWLVFTGIQILDNGLKSGDEIFVRAILATNTSGDIAGMTIIQGAIISRLFIGTNMRDDSTITAVTVIDLANDATIYLLFSGSDLLSPTTTVNMVATVGISPENYLFAIPIL